MASDYENCLEYSIASESGNLDVAQKFEATMTAIYKYYGGIDDNQSHAEDTAAGETDDKTPDEPTQIERLASLATDARSIANEVFGKSVTLTPAKSMALSEIYDMSQGYTRINKLYNMERKDFYDQSKSDLETRKNRLKYKQNLISFALRNDATVEQLRKS